MDSQYEETLRAAHDELKNGYNERQLAFIEGVLFALEMAGAISESEVRLWKLAIQSCPGHDNEGGRSWCAYCGELEPTTEEENT